MGECQMYGRAGLGTQISEPRNTEGAGVRIAVEIKLEEGETRPEAGGRELRAVSLTADEARAYALKLLAAAGPDTDRMVRNYQAGEVLLTIETPQHVLGVAPWLFVYPKDEAEFEDAVEMFGGLLAFDEPARGTRALTGRVKELAGSEQRLAINLSIPRDMRPPPANDVAQRLADQRRAQAAQTAEEQATADRLAGE